MRLLLMVVLGSWFLAEPTLAARPGQPTRLRLEPRTSLLAENLEAPPRARLGEAHPEDLVPAFDWGLFWLQSAAGVGVALAADATILLGSAILLGSSNFLLGIPDEAVFILAGTVALLATPAATTLFQQYLAESRRSTRPALLAPWLVGVGIRGVGGLTALAIASAAGPGALAGPGPVGVGLALWLLTPFAQALVMNLQSALPAGQAGRSFGRAGSGWPLHADALPGGPREAPLDRAGSGAWRVAPAITLTF